MRIVFFGLALTSSWGNGHATTYRGLLRGMRRLGHEVEFFERDVPWYAAHRDLPDPPGVRLQLYDDWGAIRKRALAHASDADAVVVGSYFPDAIAALDELLGRDGPPVCFYDIDTPITVAALEAGTCRYLRRDQVEQIAVYLSFTGGPMLEEIRERFGARRVRPLYCACDEDSYRRSGASPVAALSFLGTYASDREAKLERLMLEPARRMPEMRFRIGGSMYPAPENWPGNVGYDAHVPPAAHAAFYGQARFTLNLTRQAMVEAGYSPSIRLFEAAACGTAIISDPWPGLEEFFRAGEEILVARDSGEMSSLLRHGGEAEARRMGEAARARVMERHTCRHRAAELESYLVEAGG